MRLLPRNRFLSLPRPENDGTPGGGGSPPAPPPAPPAAPPAPPPAATTRPDYLPETFWDPTKNAVKDTDLKAHFENHSKRQAEVFSDPTKFQFKTELKDAEGKPIELNTDEPLVKAVFGLAKERGLTTGDVNALTEVVLQAEIASAEAEKKEYLAFGGGDEAKALARLTALATRGATLLGKDDQGKPTADAQKAMNTIIAGLSTKAQFEALEKLIAGDPAAATGAGAGKTPDIAKSWYGEDGLSGTGMKKAS